MAEQTTAHGLVTPGAPPVNASVAEETRRLEHERSLATGATVNPHEPTSPPRTKGNSKLLIGSSKAEPSEPLVTLTDERVEMTGDEMRKVNDLKPGSFTPPQVAGADLQPAEFERTGAATESTQLRQQAAAASGASITGGSVADNQRAKQSISSDRPSMQAAEGIENAAPVDPQNKTGETKPEADEQTTATTAKGHLPEDFPGYPALDAAGEATYAKVRARVTAGTLTEISGIGTATADRIKEALTEADNHA